MSHYFIIFIDTGGANALFLLLPYINILLSLNLRKQGCWDSIIDSHDLIRRNVLQKLQSSPTFLKGPLLAFLMSILSFSSMTHNSLGFVHTSRPLLILKLENNWCKQTLILSVNYRKLWKSFVFIIYLHCSRDVAASISHLLSVVHCMFHCAMAHFCHIFQTAVIICYWGNRNPAIESEIDATSLV